MRDPNHRPEEPSGHEASALAAVRTAGALFRTIAVAAICLGGRHGSLAGSAGRTAARRRREPTGTFREHSTGTFAVTGLHQDLEPAGDDDARGREVAAAGRPAVMPKPAAAKTQPKIAPQMTPRAIAVQNETVDRTSKRTLRGRRTRLR